MDYYNYQETIQEIDGLESISTLKKWRLKISKLTGHQFKESRVQTGRKSYSKVYIFSDDELDKLQEIAYWKSDLGLDKAILRAFAPNKDSPQTVSERLEDLSKLVVQLQNNLKKQVEWNQMMTNRLKSFEARLSDLEQPKKRSLFGK